MTTPSHAATSGDAFCRPPAAEILHREVQHFIGLAIEDATEVARRLRWIAGGERLEHGLEPDQWLSPAQCERLQRLATLAQVLAAEATAVLGEVVAPQADMG
jgi:hypothetical protein